MNAQLQDQRRHIDWQQIRSALSQAAETVMRAEQPSPETAAELLARQARALEQPLEQGALAVECANLVAFTLSAERYGIEMEWIREIVRLVDLTPVPGAPALIAGVINYRGDIVAVVDLRELFGIKTSGLVDMLNVIVVGSERVEFGVLASRVLETLYMHDEELAADPLKAVSGAGGALVKGITRDAVVVLDGQKLLTDRNLFVNECKDAGF